MWDAEEMWRRLVGPELSVQRPPGTGPKLMRACVEVPRPRATAQATA